MNGSSAFPRSRPCRCGRRPGACWPPTSSRPWTFRRSIIRRSTVTPCAMPISTEKRESRLLVVDRVTAGHAAARALAPRQAIRIFTGAPMPAGADTVFMQEDVRVEGDTLIVPPGLSRGANRRLAGEDVRAGSVVLPAGPASCRRRTLRSPRRSGSRRSTSGGAFASRCSRPATRSSSPGRRGRRPALFDANRYLLGRSGGETGRRANRPRHSAGRCASARARHRRGGAHP